MSQTLSKHTPKGKGNMLGVTYHGLWQFLDDC